MIWPWPSLKWQNGELPSYGEVLSPEEAMGLCLWIARRGAGQVAPNPMVGCVILDQSHRLIGLGYHEIFGGPHAEVNAVKDFESRGRSRLELKNKSHFFVSLEPCSHFGKTPPCADLLSEVHPLSVTVALRDPNPKVSGRGLKRIRESGIAIQILEECLTWPSTADQKIERGLRESLTDLAKDLIETFLWNQTSQSQQLPFVTLKMASTADARVSMNSGESKWITGSLARARGRDLRRESDVLISTARTVLFDNPTFESAKLRTPVAILDSSDFALTQVLLRDETGPENLGLLRSRSPQDLIIVIDARLAEAKKNALRAKGYQVVEVTGATAMTRSERLIAALRQVRDLQFQSVFLEGGSALTSAALQSDFEGQPLVHRVHHFLNPSYLGGVHAKSLSRSLEITDLNRRLKLARVRSELLQQSDFSFQDQSPDLHLTGVLRPFETAPSQQVERLPDEGSGTEVLG